MKKPKAEFISRLWRIASRYPGVGLAMLAVSLVGSRLLWIHLKLPPHLMEKAIAYGSTQNFYGQARPNHDGSQFTYVATPNDRGRALFLYDTATRLKRKILEDKQGFGTFEDNYNIQAGPWSPDDKYFICVVSSRLIVCSTEANQEKVVIEEKPFSEAEWLTTNKFVYLTDKTNLCVAQKRADGQWEHKIFLSENVPLTSLTALDSHTAAWLENDAVICRADFSTEPKSAITLRSGATNQLSDRMPDTNPPTAGLALWLDASKLKQADQSPIVGLTDLSRRPNNVVWNRNPPLFNNTNSPGALNGLGTIHFGWVGSETNGTGLKTRVPFDITGAAPRSVFAVMRHDQGRAMMVSMGDTRTNGALFAVEGERDRFYLPGGWYRDNQVLLTSTNWNLLEATYDSGVQRGYINGILYGVANVELNTVKKEVEIGYRTATGGKNPKTAAGDFAELLVYNRALNNDERKQVENYLSSKWFGQKLLVSTSPWVWYDNGLAGLTAMTYSKETGVLLLSRTMNGRNSIWRLNTTDGLNASSAQVMEGPSIRGMQWAGRDKFVYASHLDGRDSLTLADLANDEKKPLLQLWGNGSFDWFRMSPNGQHLFLFGKLSNAPTAEIWRNNLDSESWHLMVSSTEYPSIHAQPVITSRISFVSPAGGNRNYVIYRPANYDKRKKYPFVIGDTQIDDPSHGEVFMTGLAACGACVAVVVRPTWQIQLNEWQTNVKTLYHSLADDPSFDPNQVYTFGQSAETTYMSRILEESPGLWKGAIFLNPITLPDFSKSPRFQTRPRILMDAGGDEYKEDSFKSFQLQALASGAVVEFYNYSGENHRIVSSSARLERAKRVAHFVFEE